MKKTTKLLALLLALAMILSLAACGTKTETPAAEAPAEGTPAAEKPAEESPAGETPAEEAPAVDTSVLRVGMDGEPMSLDVIDAAGGVGAQFVGWSIYGSLWKFTTAGDLVYDLAKTVEPNADETEYTITLQDTAFADGTPVTAEDILFSLKVSDDAMGDRTAFIDFDKSEAVDATTLKLVMLQATPTFYDDLGVISIISKSWTEDYTNDDHKYTNIMASGAYKPDGVWTPGNPLTLVKNENYWNAENLIYDSVKVSFVMEETTRYLSFTSGEYDVCYLTDSANIDAVKADANSTLFNAVMQCNNAIVFSTEADYSDLNNQNIRLALCYGADIPAIIAASCGDAYVPATSFLPSANWAYKNVGYTYDVAKATEYYDAYKAETGKDSFAFTLSYPDSNINNAIAESLQYYYSEIGITMTCQPLDMGTFFESMKTNAMPAFITMYSGSQDPGAVLNSQNPQNIYDYSKLPADQEAALLDAMYSMEGKDARIEKFAAIQDFMHDYGKMVPLYEATINFAVGAGGPDLTNSVQADGYLTACLITK